MVDLTKILVNKLNEFEEIEEDLLLINAVIAILIHNHFLDHIQMINVYNMVQEH
jgi:hypothetical protein